MCDDVNYSELAESSFRCAIGFSEYDNEISRYIKAGSLSGHEHVKGDHTLCSWPSYSGHKVRQINGMLWFHVICN